MCPTACAASRAANCTTPATRSTARPNAGLPGAVHDARKALKRLRATVRLSPDAVGEEMHERENVAYREAGRRPSAGRDADVLLQTLGGLCERFADELPGAWPTAFALSCAVRSSPGSWMVSPSRSTAGACRR
jgi:hypothetical protein